MKIKKFLFLLITTIGLLTSLEVNAESSGGGVHDFDGLVCSDLSCTSHYNCDSSTYQNECNSLLAPSLGNFSKYEGLEKFNQNTQQIYPIFNRKVDTYQFDYSMSTQAVPLNLDHNSMNYYRFKGCTQSSGSCSSDNTTFNSSIFVGGFYSPIIYSRFISNTHYRYQTTYYISVNHGVNIFSVKNPKDFDLSEFENNTYIMAIDTNGEYYENSSSAIDNYQTSYSWRNTTDGRIRLTITTDFVPKVNLYGVVIGDGISPIGNTAYGTISNVYFSGSPSNGNSGSYNVSRSANSTYLLKFDDSTYIPIDEENYITFLSDGTISFENHIVSCSITDIACHLGNLGTVLNGTLSTISNFLQSILNFFADIFTTIVNAIKSALQWLFIPSSEDLSSVINHLKTKASEKLGILYLPIEFFENFITFTNDFNSDSYSVPLSFPTLSIGSFGTLLEGRSFDLAEYVKISPFNQIYQAYRVFISFLIAYWVYLFLLRYHNKIFGGGSD